MFIYYVQKSGITCHKSWTHWLILILLIFEWSFKLLDLFVKDVTLYERFTKQNKMLCDDLTKLKNLVESVKDTTEQQEITKIHSSIMSRSVQPYRDRYVNN